MTSLPLGAMHNAYAWPARARARSSLADQPLLFALGYGRGWTARQGRVITCMRDLASYPGHSQLSMFIKGDH